MILSVKGFSMWIAFILMGVTSFILIIGTLIVWYRQRPHSGNQIENEEEVKGHNHEKTEKEKVKRSASESDNKVVNGSVKSSGNDSPIKSRIPVRSKVKQS